MKIIIISCIIILFSEAVLSLQDQPSSEKYIRDAVVKMNFGRYGEAIDLLNKYISGNPQNPEGYTLRASCHEARGQYEYAVYDLRSALKLRKNDSMLNKSLIRVTEVWYIQLYNKIEGHKREIALIPDVASNYLEIGKCYKNLGNWTAAEDWYDRYLKLEEPSPDEVIRYTEILAKNNHISKGEIILKKFVEKFPEDHRLWSRYGYFTFWLGKNKISISAFTEALIFRPYFKEAIDGLNLAKGKGSIYTVNDTSYRFNKSTGKFQKSNAREYPIDKYYRLLRKNQSNDSLRILLTLELLNADRVEEAKQQFEILQKNHVVDNLTLTSLSKNLNDKWHQLIENKIRIAKERFNLNPSDRKSVKELGDYYVLQNYADSVMSVYTTYLSLNPNDEDIRLDFAKKLSWFKQFDEAKEHLEFLLKLNPTKKEYQLLRAQIAVWTNTDSDYAKSLLGKVSEKEPNNIEVLTSLAELNYQTQNFELAEEYIQRIEAIDVKNISLGVLKNNLVIQKKRYEEMQLDSLLNEARNLLTEKKCAEAVKLFKIYISKTSANEPLYLELANALVCSNNNAEAVNIYSNLISKKYDYDLIKQRAKLYFWGGDYINAVKEFKSLNTLSKDDAEVKLFLADSYFSQGDYISAKKIYLELQNEAPSSLMIKNRLSWLPGDVVQDASFSSFAANFPSYTLITPEVYFYRDDLSFKYNFQGMRSEFGVTKFLSAAGSFFRGDISSDSTKQKFYTVMGSVILIPTSTFTVSFGFGQIRYLNERKQNISDMTFKLETKDKYFLIGRYYSSDGSQVLYSPFLIDSMMRVTDYSIEGKYYTPTNLLLSGFYSFKKLSDDNKGYDLNLKLGRKFSQDFIGGYEYHYLDYIQETPVYYSPNQFESHSLWADYDLVQDETMDLTIGGKIGIIPKSDLLVKEFNSKLSLKLLVSLTLQVQAIFSENARDVVNYSSSSISAMVFWIF